MRALLDEHPHLGVEPVLRELHIPSSTYYRWRQAEKDACERIRQDTELTGQIRQIHQDSGGIYGSPRIHAVLKREGVHVGRKRVERLMRQAGLAGISPRRSTRCTVLAQLMRVPLPPLVTPRVLGVDDFALYADTYGTLLVDAETRLPLTLWEGRDAEQLSRWLRGHPGVEIACRDGSLTYRQGIADGAPQAVQVSDRFHLWQGLSRRVQEIAATHRGCLPHALPAPEATEPELANAAATQPESADTPAARHARRLFEAVHALTDTGRSFSSAARQLGLDRRTVRKYARARTWHEVVRRPPRRPSTLDPYLDYLQQRWDEGEHSAKILHQELLTKGYLGHYQRVKMAVAPLRRGLPLDRGGTSLRCGTAWSCRAPPPPPARDLR
ncbi:IS3 family transposase [Streptomyces canus]|uniref:IS3 family transposase n=1 Tax=Streptomyces canus TaxID=58343 RepID=UPI002782A322|nr:IS3 family transposase [Streptomyces canus]MDQ1066607.1 hypothetical protein [Streptomyces canus]